MVEFILNNIVAHPLSHSLILKQFPELVIQRCKEYI